MDQFIWVFFSNLFSGFYHRVYKVLEADAMGENTRRRGFNDRNIFMAQTTNPRIASKSAIFCKGRELTFYHFFMCLYIEIKIDILYHTDPTLTLTYLFKRLVGLCACAEEEDQG